MRVTNYGHACLLVEVDQARLLIDPGGFSAGFLELRSVRPRVAVPIHEAMLRVPQMYNRLFQKLAPEGTEVRVIDGAVPTTA